jgi:hypothetical protein
MVRIHPCVQAYLARLPDGLASYPECTAKASLLRDLVKSRPLDPEGDEVPDALRSLLRVPPPVSSWIPEVQYVTCRMIVYGRDFGGTDLAGFEQWIHAFNTALLRLPMYRVLFAFTSPERLMVGTAKRWSAFHRGTTLTITEHTPDTARTRIEFPPHLYGPEMVQVFAAGLRAAIEVAGGRGVATQLVASEPSFAEYWIRWNP